jgi:hypothetical protein
MQDANSRKGKCGFKPEYKQDENFQISTAGYNTSVFAKVTYTFSLGLCLVFDSV